jgi:hypothetical protein
MAGAFEGVLVLGDSVMLAGVTAAAMTNAPWSRISFCRDRTVVASAVMCVGIGLPLFVLRHATDPMALLIVGWLFWLCATVAVLGRILRLWQAERDIKASIRAASTRQA